MTLKHQPISLPAPRFASGRILIILTIGCLLLAGMCAIMAFNCVAKLRKDHKTYKVGCPTTFFEPDV